MGERIRLSFTCTDQEGVYQDRVCLDRGGPRDGQLVINGNPTGSQQEVEDCDEAGDVLL